MKLRKVYQLNPPTVKEVEEVLEYGKDIIAMIMLASEVRSEDVIRLIHS